MTLGNLLAGRVQQDWSQSSAETTSVTEVKVYQGITPAAPVNNNTLTDYNFAGTTDQPRHIININEILFGNPGEFRTATFSYSSDSRFFHMIFVTGSQQLPEIPGNEIPLLPDSQLALAQP